MNTKELWNLIVRDYKENYNQPEKVVQQLWENYFTNSLGYCHKEIDAQRVIHIGSGKYTIPDVIVKRDNDDLFDVELKQYAYFFNDEMEKQLISYMDLLHLSLGVLICKKLYLYLYDYAQKKIKRVAIDFKENNPDGVRFIELFSRQSFSKKEVEKFIELKNNELETVKKVQNDIQKEVNSEFLIDLLKDWFRADYSKEVLDKALADFEITLTQKTVESNVKSKKCIPKANNLVTTNAQYHQKNFWEFLEWKLQELGNPFTIKLCYSNGKPRHWAHIVKVKGVNEDINFLSKSGVLRICLYIYNKPGFYELMKEKRDLLEQALGYPVAFEVGGESNNVQWIKREWSFIPNDEDDYKKVCEQAIPEMLKFIEVFKPYM